MCRGFKMQSKCECNCAFKRMSEVDKFITKSFLLEKGEKQCKILLVFAAKIPYNIGNLLTDEKLGIKGGSP